MYVVSSTSKRRTIYALSWVRVFSLVGLQLFPLGVAKMTTINVVFYNNGSYYAIKFLPNEVEVLNSWKADMCPKVGKASEKWLFVCLLRPLREGNLMLSIPFLESQHHRSGLTKVLQFID